MHAKAKQTGLTWRMRNAAASRDSVLGSGNSNGNEIPLRCSLGLDLHFYATLFNSNPTGARVRRFVGLALALRCFCFYSARDKKKAASVTPKTGAQFLFGFLARKHCGVYRTWPRQRPRKYAPLGWPKYWVYESNPIPSDLVTAGAGTPHSSVIRPAFSNANLPTSRDRRMGSDISDG